MLVSGVGMLLGLAPWRVPLVACAMAVALLFGLRGKPPRLGRQRQVPRRWGSGTAVGWVYVVWGAMLGCGVATPVFHTSFIVLLVAQATANPWLALVTGAAFGGTRQAMALLPVVGRYAPPRTMQLLETLRPAAKVLNIVLALAGGAWLLVAT